MGLTEFFNKDLKKRAVTVRYRWNSFILWPNARVIISSDEHRIYTATELTVTAVSAVST